VAAKWTVLIAAERRSTRCAGLLARTVWPAAVVTETRKRALNDGSSKQGKKRRASVASSCVKA
jgi:hypothetical protein